MNAKFPHIDRMQRTAVPLALSAIAAGSVVAGLVLDDPGGARIVRGILVIVTTAYFSGLAWAYFEGNRRWLQKVYRSTWEKSQAGQTPISVRIWATGLDDDSWRRYAPRWLRPLPFVKEVSLFRRIAQRQKSRA